MALRMAQSSSGSTSPGKGVSRHSISQLFQNCASSVTHEVRAMLVRAVLSPGIRTGRGELAVPQQGHGSNNSTDSSCSLQPMSTHPCSPSCLPAPHPHWDKHCGTHTFPSLPAAAVRKRQISPGTCHQAAHPKSFWVLMEGTRRADPDIC